jgi:predicted Rossmann-fold nucleotide-binding protein
MVDWLRETVAAERKINPEDLDLFRLTDDPAEAVEAVIAGRNGPPPKKRKENPRA